MRKTKLRLLAAGAAAAAASAVALVSMPAAYAETATFSVTNPWSTGYQAGVVVKNDTSAALSTWRVELTLPSGTTVSNAWNATQATSGNTYTFTPAGWNAQVAPGASVEFGLIVNGTGRPTACLVNGKACTGTVVTPSSPGTTSEPP